ncbi:hypothetical protein J5N97_028000 [Dioscorea zingiberensis]|uniref:BHLH domain-containing protein n=1 Tax=Dioscorea zingiberensis TaxID=325984 RepID=A0A9D5BY59_9LILI|nr:hypothetical protein J5N97_028000 [Dioscorea zingiberensis]
MLHCMASSTSTATSSSDLSVLERQRAWLQCQQQQQQSQGVSYLDNNMTSNNFTDEPLPLHSLPFTFHPSYQQDHGQLLGNPATGDGSGVSKKRKPGRLRSPSPNLDGSASEECAKEKRMKEGDDHDEKKIKEAHDQKSDFIHVRARRGQATDSHSLAERVRREKISARMRYLQDLVPGCNRITGKAGMLDEIINYVQSLQRQVEFLSMKLAATNPRLDFNIDNLFSKEINAMTSNNMIPGIIGMSSSEVIDLSCYQFNPSQQAVNSSDHPFLDSSFNIHGVSSTWGGTDLNSVYNLEMNQQKGSAFSFQLYQGNVIANNPKMEN